MTRTTVRIAMNGVTGRMGYRQHLLRSVLALREQGGLELDDGTAIWPEPVLVGRREHALRAIAERHGLEHWTTDLDGVLADPATDVYFDAQLTSAREAAVRKAIAAGKHVYCEKPAAGDLGGALELARLARDAGVKHGVVQDKIFLPGLRKLKRLVDGGFFGEILSVRGEFGYWVFEGDWQPAQRPSWNYRAQDGGGIVMDMFPHWEYVLHELFGPVRSVQAEVVTHVPRRWDERGKPYEATADDAAYGIFRLDGGAVAQINSSWAVRVHRDELVEFQVDGTEGSAVAGLRGCRAQHRSATPKPVWNPDLPATESFREQWQEVPDNEEFDNGFKAQWELFLRHVVLDEPWSWDLLAGARGVQLAELGLRSAAEGRRLDVPELSL
ncbi:MULTISPECIES: Gfo/Idh/MocA family protein [Streptomyces]|uniref:Gfo/Idh/MocA family oxidoreductase n=2 Tax=Streptomyces TaxID=1883 RepID=A0A3R7J753_9ACTN|nr:MULTISPECIES: Gfo/Idh/MocA family oxidoreductase [Streptomyces]KNE82492.1 oxidoreductase [Streptomyces fradiae]OFA49452.1 oxidoreductase [Streptomyces fradiae]PQM22931.1 gfo/Idh/MocA family oxidoreductase [Streptomyces xinghaiensis]RKM97405.1 gfo/Idh/MocA family oxidoreductase [Streptomyces xinghaiensis]RNC73761.1 gfo/Idh/MocA family oxidoreductase [Streptomyces xinghaiensis]